MYSFDQNGSTSSAYEAHSDGQVSHLLEILIIIHWMSRYSSGSDLEILLSSFSGHTLLSLLFIHDILLWLNHAIKTPAAVCVTSVTSSQSSNGPRESVAIALHSVQYLERCIKQFRRNWKTGFYLNQLPQDFHEMTSNYVLKTMLVQCRYHFDFVCSTW